MEYRRLGKYGLKVSELSLGAWVTFGGQVGEDVARACILAAYEAGVNFFDNADMYSKGNAEIVMGNVIKELKRTDLVISSKVYWPMGDGPNDRWRWQLSTRVIRFWSRIPAIRSIRMVS